MKNLEKFIQARTSLFAAARSYVEARGDFYQKVFAANGRKLYTAADAAIGAAADGMTALTGVTATFTAATVEAAKSIAVSEADEAALAELMALFPSHKEEEEGGVSEEDISTEQAFEEVFASTVRRLNGLGWNTLSNSGGDDVINITIPEVEWAAINIYASGGMYIPDRIRRSTADFVKGKTALDLLTQPLPEGWVLCGRHRYVDENEEAAE